MCVCVGGGGAQVFCPTLQYYCQYQWYSGTSVHNTAGRGGALLLLLLLLAASYCSASTTTSTWRGGADYGSAINSTPPSQPAGVAARSSRSRSSSQCDTTTLMYCSQSLVMARWQQKPASRCTSGGRRCVPAPPPPPHRPDHDHEERLASSSGTSAQVLGSGTALAVEERPRRTTTVLWAVLPYSRLVIVILYQYLVHCTQQYTKMRASDCASTTNKQEEQQKLMSADCLLVLATAQYFLSTSLYLTKYHCLVLVLATVLLCTIHNTACVFCGTKRKLQFYVVFAARVLVILM